MSGAESVPVASVRPSEEARSRLWRRVELAPAGAVMPEECACCGGAVSSHVAVRRGRDAAELLVGYCDSCLAHAGKDGTRVLGVSLASLLLALTLGSAIPLLFPASLALHVALVLAAASAPLLLAWLLRPRPANGHSAWGGAVVFEGSAIGCARGAYTDAVLSLNPAAREVDARRPPWFSAWMLAGPLLGACFTPFVHELSFPTLRVLNLTGERFELLVDGRRWGSVEPTSVESPAAGREFEVPAGEHLFEVKSHTGELVGRERARVVSGKVHLFAPASDAYCFWVETVSFGRLQGEPERRALDGEQRFWTLPDGIDGFFTPPPVSAGSGETLSGGTVTVLRQAPCTAAPAEVGAQQGHL